MRVLVVGSGGREHALCWKLAASPLLTKLWCAPGNPGTASHAESVAIEATDIAALVAFAIGHEIDLVVPGPEAPLVAGLADALGLAGIACCGPSAAAARIEGSKSFAKEICEAAGIPTARWERFEDAVAARDFIRRRGAPIVVKADGLAAGKGVVVAATEDEAEAAIARLGMPVVIEEMLVGDELSFFALCDGTHAIPLGSARDHKRAGDGDTGPMTGGMGAFSPVAAVTPAVEGAIIDRIIRPALAELSRQGTPYRGVLFAGLFLTADGPLLVEFNARFGDPECQALLPRLRSDLLPALVAACDGGLDRFALRWSAEASVAVVLAAPGYPDAVERGAPVRGLDAAAAVPGVLVFQAGTAWRDGALVMDAGRVLTIAATGPDVAAARRTAYEGADHLAWPGVWRHDIAASG